MYLLKKFWTELIGLLNTSTTPKTEIKNDRQECFCQLRSPEPAVLEQLTKITRLLLVACADVHTNLPQSSSQLFKQYISRTAYRDPHSNNFILFVPFKI